MKKTRLFTVNFFKSFEIPELLFGSEDEAKEFDTVLSRYLLDPEAIQEFIKLQDIEIISGPCTEVLIESIEKCNFIFDEEGLKPNTEGDGLCYFYINTYLKERL